MRGVCTFFSVLCLGWDFKFKCTFSVPSILTFSNLHRETCPRNEYVPPNTPLSYSKKIQVANDHKKAQSERNSHCKNRGSLVRSPSGVSSVVALSKSHFHSSMYIVYRCFIKFLSEGLPEFYGDLVYKFKKLIGINDFSFQFRKIITRYRRIGYNLNVMRQSACLVFNPIMVDNYAAFFNCTPVGLASESMIAPT